MNILLNESDIDKISGDGTIVLSYPDLYEYNSISDLFSNRIKKVVILYLQEKHGNSMRGHWCILTKYKDTVSFFDPYGLMPDSELDWNTAKEKVILNQQHRYLTRLLYEYVKNGGNVEYNEMRFQQKGEDINTCGRHVGLRGRFFDIGLQKYQELFKKMRTNGYNLDEIVVDLSDMYL